MRADIKPGAAFPDYQLPDHTGTPRRLSEIQGSDPMIIMLALFIVLIIRAAIRLVKLFFRQIEAGKIVFHNFPAEWADPTYKITRLLLVAFGLVVAFPYLPASDSAAFAGVSVFMGVLFSLSSSSAISNAIAGVVLTYTGAFRLGERVRLGETFGDVPSETVDDALQFLSGHGLLHPVLAPALRGGR